MTTAIRARHPSVATSSGKVVPTGGARPDRAAAPYRAATLYCGDGEAAQCCAGRPYRTAQVLRGLRLLDRIPPW